MIKLLSKGPDYHSIGQISYATIMSEFRHVDDKTGCCVFHESYSPMWQLFIEPNHAKKKVLKL
jgi:hypothetical protein